MQELSAFFHNQILIVALIACGTAQLLKIPIDILRSKKTSIRSLFSSGGMPSSHSALVGALATGVGQAKGWDSSEFAIACLFAVIVMYDAAGVRQAAGKQARILNQIIEDMFQEKEFKEEKLKELLGHTPIQVLAGLSLGIAIACFANYQLV